MLPRRMLFRLFASVRSDPGKLARLEQVYKQDPNNLDHVRRYARELNRNERYNEALNVVKRVPPNKITKELRAQAEYAQARQLPPESPRMEPGEEKPEPKKTTLWSNRSRIFGIVVFCYFAVLTFSKFCDLLKQKSKKIQESKKAQEKKKEEPSKHDSAKLKAISQDLHKKKQTQHQISELSGEMIRPSRIPQRLSDVKGIDEITGEIHKVIDILRHHEKYRSKGAVLPKGVLLYGKPGTGKTLIARAMAGEAGVTFFHYTGSQFDELFVGVGAKRIRSMFQQAKKHKPCIIFIDEIDSLLTRERRLQENSSNSATINEFLSHLDGFEPAENILIVGATNDLRAIDPAALRPGRFDYKIHVPLPDSYGRKQIFEYYINKIAHNKSVDAKKLSLMTPGFTGAEIENLVNLAITRAVNMDKEYATMEDFEYARDRILMGLERKTLVRSNKDLMSIAIHEAGRALTTYYTAGYKGIYKATIAPRGSTLGGTYNLPKEKEQFSLTRGEIKDKICALLGGYVAEKHFLGSDNISTHCKEDLKKATELAYGMIRRFGMEDEKYGLSVAGKENLSEAENAKVDQAVNMIIKEAMEFTEKLLKDHEFQAKLVAQKLFEYEYLTGEEIDKLLKGQAIDKKKVRELSISI